MTQLASHPARSFEFLSRLHDGELSAAERAQFESHRAHCSECRGAAAEFEAALALYRSSRPGPASADLSARILRKLQATNRRRSTFGVTFGIDLRWAGALLAALLAVIIGSSVVGRREASERRVAREAAPIPVVIERDRAGDLVEKKAKTPASDASHFDFRDPDADRVAATARKRAAKPNDKFAAAPPSSQASSDSARVFATPTDLQKETSTLRYSGGRASAARPAEEKPEAPPAPASQKTEPSATSFYSSERAGGEGAMSSNNAADGLAVRARLEILPLDGAGTPPALVGGTDVELPADLRGRVFIFVVEASGRVQSVRPSERRADLKKDSARQRASEIDVSPADAKAPQALKDLRFQAGARSRVLRVRIE
jgi:hypothetical protein